MTRITIAYFRDIFNQFHKGEISMSRMVEMLNEKSNNKMNQEEIRERIEILHQEIEHNEEEIEMMMDEIKQLEKQL